tara:strand:+ start:1195 stop:1470 length:276 start_codon:yes stop_codon:yes gene_type:complete
MFNKADFNYSGGYLTYQNKFVARFKYRGPFTKAKFQKELIANHTPESYFKALNEDGKAPLDILRTANTRWYQRTFDAFVAKHSRKVHRKEN